MPCKHIGYLLHDSRTALLAILIILGTYSRTVAQAPSLEVYYDRLSPETTFKYKYKGMEGVCNVGAFRWEVPPSQFGTGGLDRNFTGYCAEIDVQIVEGKLYRFQPMGLSVPRFYGLEDSPEGIKAADRRATLIRELFGRYYTESKTAHPDETFAFQVALWELTHEKEPMDRAISFDLFAGDFQANYPKDQAPNFVLLAQAYLDSLVGDDAPFYENQDIKGRELVRLQGIPNAENVVAQSQYALRYMNGGAPGVSPFAGQLGNGSTGAFGGAGPGFGAGAGAGAGGIPAAGGPFITTGFPSSSTTPIPSTGPPTGGQGRVPGGGPQTTPVPAPAGFLLGLVALGAFASRRVYTRLLQK